MSDIELKKRLADLLDITDRANYDSCDSLAEELQDEIGDEITEEQHYEIADIVERWWSEQE